MTIMKDMVFALGFGGAALARNPKAEIIRKKLAVMLGREITLKEWSRLLDSLIDRLKSNRGAAFAIIDMIAFDLKKEERLFNDVQTTSEFDLALTRSGRITLQLVSLAGAEETLQLYWDNQRSTTPDPSLQDRALDQTGLQVMKWMTGTFAGDFVSNPKDLSAITDVLARV